MKHPMQKLERDEHGTMRFVANPIVRTLLDDGPLDMNKIAILGFSAEDQMQFAQLIGYSVGGYCELSYVSDESFNAAQQAVAGIGGTTVTKEDLLNQAAEHAKLAAQAAEKQRQHEAEVKRLLAEAAKAGKK